MIMKNKNPIKTAILLFLFFVKIGCFTFGGGWAILAQMEQEFVDKRKLITKEELLEMVAVGKSVPGIMITNISLLFGYHVAGIPGAVCCVFGITLPAIVILSIVTLFYNYLSDNYWFLAAMTGIRAAVIPIIASATISLGKSAVTDVTTVVILGAAFVASILGMSNIGLVLAGAAIALVYHAAGKRVTQSGE